MRHNSDNETVPCALANEQAELADIVKRSTERLEQLTPREREVFAEVARGRLNKQIAHDLGISEVTVKLHRGNVMRKMKANSLADLVRMSTKLEPILPAHGREEAVVPRLSVSLAPAIAVRPSLERGYQHPLKAKGMHRSVSAVGAF